MYKNVHQIPTYIQKIYKLHKKLYKVQTKNGLKREIYDFYT